MTTPNRWLAVSSAADRIGEDPRQLRLYLTSLLEPGQARRRAEEVGA